MWWLHQTPKVAKGGLKPRAATKKILKKIFDRYKREVQCEAVCFFSNFKHFKSYCNRQNSFFLTV